MKIQHVIAAIVSVAMFSSCALFGSVPWEQFVNEVTPPVNRVLNAGKSNDLDAALLEFDKPSEAKANVSALFNARRDVFNTVIQLNKREDGRFASVTQGVNSAKIELRIAYGGSKTAIFRFNTLKTLTGWKFQSVEIAP